MRLCRIKIKVRRIRAPLVLLATAGLLALSIRMLSSLYSHALPYAQNLADAAATTSVSAIINKVISERSSAISEALESCTSETIADGELRSITVDSMKINTIRAELSSEIIRRLENMRTIKVKVPIGCLIGSDLLFGRGPSISIKLPARGSVTTDIGNSFVSAGINQTRHIITVSICVKLSLSLPDGSFITSVVETSSELAQFIIVGRIPSAFLNQ